MNRLWRGIAIFVLGGVLGTGIRRCTRILHLSLRLPAAGGRRTTCRSRACQARRVRHVHSCQSVRPGALREGPCQRLRAHRLSRARLRGRARTGVPRLSGAQSVDPLDLGRERCDVRRSRGFARLQGQPALSDPGRRQPEGLSKRDHLVRAFWRSHLPSGPDDSHGREVRVYLAETPKCERLTDALDESGPQERTPTRHAGVLFRSDIQLAHGRRCSKTTCRSRKDSLLFSRRHVRRSGKE